MMNCGYLLVYITKYVLEGFRKSLSSSLNKKFLASLKKFRPKFWTQFLIMGL